MSSHRSRPKCGDFIRRRPVARDSSAPLSFHEITALPPAEQPCKKSGPKAADGKTLHHAKSSSKKRARKAADKPALKAADQLIKIAESAQLFHASDGVPYADVVINGHRETLLVRGRSFKQWLARAAYLKNRTAAPSEAMGSALSVIESRARYDGATQSVSVRVGSHDGRLYLDLCDADWRAVEIDAFGWRIVDSPPVRFRRSAGMLPLPVPVRGMGGIERLRPLLNFTSGQADGPDWTLATAWLLAALRDKGPYPILAFTAEQGAGKSIASRLLRSLVDPNAAPLRSLPREDRDLFIAASNAHVLCFDNVSTIQPWQSDTLCRLSTGGGFASRTLYADSDETIFDASRPIILNGIDDFLTRADAADRAIVLQLAPIPEIARRPESEILREFEAARPAILGGLLDAVSRGLANLPSVRLERLPRLADFALWATACENGDGAFMRALEGNRAAAIETVIDADPVASFVAVLLANSGAKWTGTAGELLDKMESATGTAQRNAGNFPKTARAVSAALKRAAPFLRKSGISLTGPAREANTGKRIIRLERPAPRSGTEPSRSSLSSEAQAINGFDGDGRDDRDGVGPTCSGGACPRCGGEGCGWCVEVAEART